MFSRFQVPKNVKKCTKILKAIKTKLISKQNNLQVYKKYLPTSYNFTVDFNKTKNELEPSVVATFSTLKHFYKEKVNQKLNLRNKFFIAAVGVKTVHTPANSSSTEIGAIPEPPVIPSQEVVDALQHEGEVPFEQLGLGGWGPVGIVQKCLEYLHISLDLPWWGAIAIGTVVVRILMFPLVIIAQRNGAKMNNYLPQLQVLQLKMTEARQTGNQLEAARYGQEMMSFMKEKQLNPLKNMLVPLAQMPLFISFFVGLRQMANCPVETMKDGGLFWFTDLTLPDQYFLLPVLTSITMWATIEIGTDTARLSAQNMQMMKYVLRALPIIVLPFTINFPGAILCYWVCTNFISLIQVGFLRIPAVRDFFKIEPMVQHSPDSLPIQNKGFMKGMKESWTNMKITNEIEGRRRFDEMQFQKAGKGPIVKTYKFDPTKQSSSAYSMKK